MVDNNTHAGRDELSRRDLNQAMLAGLVALAFPARSDLDDLRAQPPPAGVAPIPLQTTRTPSFRIIALPRLASPETSPYKSEHIQDLLNHWPQSGDGRDVTLTAKDAITEFKRGNFSPTTLGHELVHRIQEAIVRRFGRASPPFS